ncbi:hypothetical protein ABEI22_13160 [Erwinia billingiae]|uniref:hypothetical protein n=1 Tax=Erwinia billingiae TaxID=182337 RepID=UPI00320A994D
MYKIVPLLIFLILTTSAEGTPVKFDKINKKIYAVIDGSEIILPFQSDGQENPLNAPGVFNSTPTLEFQKLINSGYEEISIQNYFGHNYLIGTTKNEVNKCSVLFGIANGEINNSPMVGVNEQICNVSVRDNKVVSSWRDEGKWNDDVYKINEHGKWILIFRDSCIGCEQVKRVFYKSGKLSEGSLLTDGDDFTSRKELIGEVAVKRASLFKESDLKMKSKSYLVKGDVVTFSDMSNNGDFYKIKYKTNAGKILVSWMRSDDFNFR